MSNQRITKKKAKKRLFIVTSSVLVMSTVTPGVLAAANFSDISKTSHREAIIALADRGVISGYKDGTFKPNKALTRADVVKMLGKFLVQQYDHAVPSDYARNVRFSDISDKDDELKRYAAVVYDAGIFVGTNGKLDPKSFITRENVALVLDRLVVYLTEVNTGAYVLSKGIPSKVKDLNKAKGESRNSIKTIEYFNLTIVENYRPKESTTRGQFASFLYRLLMGVLENEEVLQQFDDYKWTTNFNLNSISLTANSAVLFATGKNGIIVTVKDASGTELGQGVVNVDGTLTIILNRPVEPNEKLIFELSDGQSSKDMPYTTPSTDRQAKDALNNALQIANQTEIVAVSTNGNDVANNKLWTTASEKSAFENAKNAAQAIYNNPNATKQQMLDSTDNLLQAIQDYNAAKKPGLAAEQPLINKTALTNKLAEANAIQNASVSINGADISSTDKWVTQAEQTAFNNAKNAASSVLANGEATQAQVDNAVTALNNAMNVYINAMKPGTKVEQPGPTPIPNPPPTPTSTVDKTALQAQLTLAGNVMLAEVSVDGADVPYGEPWVTQAEQEAFNDAKAAAQAVMSNANATAQQVADAVAALQSAINAYDAAKEDGTFVDKTALQNAINDANTAKTAITSPDGRNIPTTQEWVRSYIQNAFTQAIAAANAVLNDNSATPQQVADAVQAMNDATTAYNNEKKPGLLVDLTTLADLIHTAENIPLVAISSYDGYDIYTTEQWVTQQEQDDLLAAIQAAKDAMTNANTDQAIINAVQALQAAMDTYEDAKEDGRLIDRTALMDALTAAQQEPQAIVAPNGDNIPPGTLWVTPNEQAAFDDMLNEAITVFNDLNATEQDIADTAQKLHDAINEYSLAKEDGTYVEPVDKTALSDKIVDANKVVQAIVSTNGEDVLETQKWVTQADKTAFENAMNAAQAVYDSATASTSDVATAVSNLDAAISAYETAKEFGLKASPTSKADLLTALNMATTVDLVTVAEDGNMIPPEDEWVTEEVDEDLKEAILQAQAIYNDPNALKTEVDTAITNLNNAVAAYNTAKQPGTYTLVDKTPLQTAIASADATIIAIISTNGNDVNPDDIWTTQAAYDAFIASKDAAVAAYKKSPVTQQEIDDATDSLLAAIATYDFAKSNGSEGNAELKDTLAALIAQANAILTVFTSETGGNNVQPTDMWVDPDMQTDFQAAINAALAVYNLTDPAIITNVMVSDAIYALQQAINVYTPQPGTQATRAEKEGLYDALDDANNIALAIVSTDGKNVDFNDEWVTPAEQQAFNDAKNAAQQVFNNANATGAEVAAAITALNDAISAYEAAKEAGSYVAPADKTALQNAIASADTVALVTVAANGNNVPDTKQWVTPTEQQAFNDAKTAANAVLNDPAATAQEIADATDAMLAAIANYEDAKETGLFVDRSALAAKIAAANAVPLFPSSTDGSDILLGSPWVDYTEQQAFTDAKATAQQVFNDPTSSSQNIADAVTALQAAMDAYAAADEPGTMQPDKSALQRAHDAAEAMTVAVVSVDGKDVDSAADWIEQSDLDAFMDAIADAEAVLQDNTKTQSEIDAAVTALAQAVEDYYAALKSGTKPLINTVNLNYENNKVTQLTEINGVKTNEKTRRTSFLSGQGLLTSADITFSGNEAPPLFFEVADGEQLDVRIKLEHASLAELGTYEIALYKLNADGTAYEKVSGTEQSYGVVGAIGLGVQTEDEFEFNDVPPGEYIVLSVATIGGSLVNVTDTTLLQANLTQSVEAQNASAGPISGTIALGTQSAVTAVTPTKAGTAEVAITAGQTAVIEGEHGTLRIGANGQYTYTTQGNLDDIGEVDVFEFKVLNGTKTTTHMLYIRHDLQGTTDALVWDNNNLADDAIMADTLSVTKSPTVATTAAPVQSFAGKTGQLFSLVYNEDLVINGRDSMLSFKIHATNLSSVSPTNGTYEVRDALSKQVFLTGQFTKLDHGKEIKLTNLPAGKYEIAFERASLSGTYGVQSATVSNVNWTINNSTQFTDSLPITDEITYDPTTEIFMSLGSKLKVGAVTISADENESLQGQYGTLQLKGDGTYTYKVDRDLLRAAYEATSATTYTETFNYSIVSPNGSETSADSITIELQMPTAPVKVNTGAFEVPAPSATSAFMSEHVPLKYVVTAQMHADTTVDGSYVL